MVGAVDEQAALAVAPSPAIDPCSAAAGLLDEPVEDRAARLREHEPGPRRIAVDDRREPVRPDEDRVRLAAEVEQLEAGAPLRLLAARRARRSRSAAPRTSGSVSTRSTVAPRMWKISRKALRAPGENASTPASTASRIAKPSASGRRRPAPARRPLEAEVEARRRRVGDLAAELLQAALELGHAVSPTARPAAHAGARAPATSST